MAKNPLIGIVMGSESDRPIVDKICSVLDDFAVPYEVKVLSAHRTPKKTGRYASSADSRGLKVLIGVAGMAAALYTGRAKLKTLLLDRAGMGGGQLMNTELIEDYPAIKSITGSEMATAFEEQIREFGVEGTWGEVSGIEVDYPRNREFRFFRFAEPIG